MSSRERIIDAAMSLFVRHGYRLTSMEQVGREAGLTRQALYHHFDTKEALFRAVAATVQEEAQESASSAGLEMERTGAGLAAVLVAQILARWRSFSDRTKGSPYADELLSEHRRQSEDLHQIFVEKEYRLFVETIDRFRERGVRLDAGMTSANLARCIQLAAHGAKADMVGEAGPSDLERIVRLLVRGATVPSEDGETPTATGVEK
jgi:AcrR family transcriptional regulator